MTTTNTPERATARAELLPCPFCGAPCQHPWNYGDTRDGLHRFVECTKCGANMYRFRQTQDEADAALYEAWNARINTHDALQAENKRLREAVVKFIEWMDAEPVDGRIEYAYLTQTLLPMFRTLLNPQEPNNG